MKKAFNFKNYKKGITLIEVLIVVVIVLIFSGIFISDFPKIRLQLALSRAANKFEQDIRKVQDMALSGVQFYDSSGDPINAKGYGIYINLEDSNSKGYTMYADLDNDKQFVAAQDFVIENVDFSKTEPGVIIKNIENLMDSSEVCINFTPPNPEITISDLVEGQTRVQIIFVLESEQTKTKSVFVNTAGLVEIK